MKLYLTDKSVTQIKEVIPADWFVNAAEIMANGDEVDAIPVEFENKGKTLLFELFPDCSVDYCGKGCEKARTYDKAMDTLVKLGYAYWAEPVEEVFEDFADTKPRNFWHS